MTVDEAISAALRGISSATQLELPEAPESGRPHLLAKKQAAELLLQRLAKSQSRARSASRRVPKAAELQSLYRPELRP